MAVGFRKGVYVQDDGSELIVKVEADHFANAQLAWTEAAAGLPRTGYAAVTPRRVHGVNAVAGVVKRASLIVPDIAADAWASDTAEFTDKDNDGTLITYTVTSRVGEVRRYGM